MQRSAILSPCGTYRYRLDRSWEEGTGKVAFVMLNPSTADAEIDDPTIKRCVAFAKGWGYKGLIVGNLFGYRATDPKELERVASQAGGGGLGLAVGPENPRMIAGIVRDAALVVCAWGAHGTLHGAGGYMRGHLSFGAKKPHYLRLTKDGHPGHPLYLPSDLKPQEWV